MISYSYTQQIPHTLCITTMWCFCILGHWPRFVSKTHKFLTQTLANVLKYKKHMSVFLKRKTISYYRYRVVITSLQCGVYYSKTYLKVSVRQKFTPIDRRPRCHKMLASSGLEHPLCINCG